MRWSALDLLAETMTTAWRRAASLPVEPEQARMWMFGITKLVFANADAADADECDSPASYETSAAAR